MTSAFRKYFCLFPIFLWLSACSDSPHPLTVQGLQQLWAAPSQGARLSTQGAVNGLNRQILRFSVDGLEQKALLLSPSDAAAKRPLLLFLHGFHPNPPEYGMIDGKSARPGAYYGELARAYAALGMDVLIPDYRGHNDSEGFEFTQSPLAPYWYSRDAIAALKALESLTDSDRPLFLAGHSMGGIIVQRLLVSAGDRFRAASLWATAEPDLAETLRRDMGAGSGDAIGQQKPYLAALKQALATENISASDLALAPYWAQWQSPTLLQHGRADTTTPVAGSLRLAAQLFLANQDYELQITDTADHLFTGQDFERAVARDRLWFTQARGQ